MKGRRNIHSIETMRSSSGGISIAASSQTVDVDNRISLRFYYRIADNILRQADIFREEGNFIDLYIMLLRFSSLIHETIPRHKDYKVSPQNRKVFLNKKLLNAMTEMEKLKPIVRQKIDELNQQKAGQMTKWSNACQDDPFDSSSEWPPVQRKTLTNYSMVKLQQPAIRDISNGGSRVQQLSYSRPVEEQFKRFTMNVLPPTEETLSKHSILGPNGLHGKWQPPRGGKKVQYPNNIDSTPIKIPSLLQSVEDEYRNDSGNLGRERSRLESMHTQIDNTKISRAEEPCPLISFESAETTPQTDIIRQPSPPPVLADVQDLIPAMSPQITETKYEMEKPLPDASVHSESPLQLHISSTLMSNFMKLAKSNTEKNLETCGVLAGVLKDRKFFVTTLIIPKQESTSDTCQTTNEEEIFEVQDKQALFPLGWIHTHPTQSCFMSSVDVHTQYSYQIMLPEAIAIVMAPRDTSKTHGIFRLSVPGGMSVIRQCRQHGFHPHDQPSDGGPIYKHCTDVYMNPDINFNVVDLR